MQPDPRPTPADGSFSDLLSRARRAAGLTQQECADRAGIGVRTLRDLERGRAKPQRSTADLLVAALGLRGSDREAFLGAARREPGSRPAAAVHGISLPPPPLLVGREQDLIGLDAVLRQAALVTLVGVAGVGKTSLAWRAAHQVAGRHPGGVAGVVISEVSTVTDILAIVASVFGVPRAEDLPHRLADGPALLMIDAIDRNPVPAVAAMLWLQRHTGNLRLLATGRLPSGIDGELVWPVAPLETPPARESTLAGIRGYPASQLFLSRLRAVGHPEVTEAQAPALAELVRRLAGLPLALELGAACGRILRVEEIFERYGGRVLDLRGSGDDATTLRDAVAASYRLLSPDERAALRALALFTHRWSVEQAEPMLAGRPGAPLSEDLVGLLDRLVGLGLVSIRGTGARRFRLLDVVRDFALEQAGAAGELAGAQARHAEVVADQAAQLAPGLVGASLTRTMATLDDMAGDLRAALVYAADHDPPTALRLAASLPRWWRFRGQERLGQQWLRQLLDDPRTVPAGAAVRAWAQLGHAQLATERGAATDEVPVLESALATFARLGEVAGQLAVHTQLCVLHHAAGDYAAARRHGEAGLALAIRHGRKRDIVVAQNNLTWHEIRVGNLAGARRRLRAVQRLAAEVGEYRLGALAHANLAEVARLDGRYAEAVTLARQAVVLLEELGDPRHRRRLQGIIGLAQAQAGQFSEARHTVRDLTDDGMVALIEGYLALADGHRAVAVDSFAAAAEELAGKADVRDVVEALVGVAGAADDPVRRQRALTELAELCRHSGVNLLDREWRMLGLDPRTGWAGLAGSVS